MIQIPHCNKRLLIKKTLFVYLVGSFQCTQYLDIIGPVADNRNPFVMHQQVIHSVPLKLIGKADLGVVKKQPVFNQGRKLQ